MASSGTPGVAGRLLRQPLDREIWWLALPAMGALAAEPLYVLADTAVVGRLGTPQLGGLAVAATVLLTGYALFVFLAYGTTASVARLLGAGLDGAAPHEGVRPCGWPPASGSTWRRWGWPWPGRPSTCSGPAPRSVPSP